MSLVFGLDLSLTHTGIAAGGITGAIKPKVRGCERLAFVRDEVMSHARRARLVVIEGYSMGTARQSSHAHGLGELGGVIRLALWEAGVPYAEVPPACLKRYATGKGNANKGLVGECVTKRWPDMSFDGDDNRVDAWVLYQMGLAYACGDLDGQCPEALLPAGYVRVPATHRAGLAGVEWPSLAVAA